MGSYTDLMQRIDNLERAVRFLAQQSGNPFAFFATEAEVERILATPPTNTADTEKK